AVAPSGCAALRSAFCLTSACTAAVSRRSAASARRASRRSAAPLVEARMATDNAMRPLLACMVVYLARGNEAGAAETADYEPSLRHSHRLPLTSVPDAQYLPWVGPQSPVLEVRGAPHACVESREHHLRPRLRDALQRCRGARSREPAAW